MSFSSLPRELLDLPCTLTCKTLSLPARARLFSSLTINYGLTTESKASAIKALKDTLESDKELAAGVKSLRVHIWNAHHWHASSVHALTSRVQGLPGVLHALRLPREEGDSSTPVPQLHAIGICIFGGEFMEWDAFHGHFRSALEDLCVASRISTFCLEGIFSFETALILHCMPGLKRLDMTGSEFEPFPNKLPRLRTGETPCPQLEELHIKDTAVKFYMWQSEVPKRLFGSLKILDIQPSGHRGSMLYLRIWEHCPASLRTLKLVCTTSDSHSQMGFPAVGLNLSSFPSLQIFIIEVRNGDIVKCSNLVQWVSELFKYQKMKRLETIRLDIISTNPAFFVKYESGHLEPKSVLLDSVKSFEEALAEAHCDMKSLRTVNVRVLQSVNKFKVSIDDPSIIPPHVNVVDLTPRLKYLL